jgi:hypothetical protein
MYGSEGGEEQHYWSWFRKAVLQAQLASKRERFYLDEMQYRFMTRRNVIMTCENFILYSRQNRIQRPIGYKLIRKSRFFKLKNS